MHPRDLGALHMQRLIVLAAVCAAVCTTIISGPQLIPASASPSDLAQWVFYSPNLILPLCAGACALAAIIKAVTARRHTHMWTDTGWFILTRLYLACYLALIVACAILPAMHLGSPVPRFMSTPSPPTRTRSWRSTHSPRSAASQSCADAPPLPTSAPSLHCRSSP